VILRKDGANREISPSFGRIAVFSPLARHSIQHLDHDPDREDDDDGRTADCEPDEFRV
jgi:hypothetical protein